MKCQAIRCHHEAAYVVEGPGGNKSLCGCCAERATDIAQATGIRVEVESLNGVKPCAILVGDIDFETMSDRDLVRLHDLAHDALEARAASRKRGIA